MPYKDKKKQQEVIEQYKKNNSTKYKAIRNAAYHRNKHKHVAKKASMHRLRTYGLTEPQYQDLLSKQNNSCACCYIKLMRSHVDHDHKTGKVRGLLCPRCNVALGYLEDKELLSNLEAYLAKNS